MVEFLTAVALAWTGRYPVMVHCPAVWTASQYKAYTTIYQNPYRAEIWMPRYTCRDLRTKAPWPESIDDFTHELIHVKYPRVRHGVEMRYAVKKFRAQVCRRLRVSCKRTYPKPERYPGLTD